MPEKIIGYARTANNEGNIDSQIDALRQAGCTEIYTDVATSGHTFRQSGLHQARASLQRGDSFMVVSIDRIARNIGVCHDFVRGLMRDGIEFTTLTSKDEATALMDRINYGPAPRPGSPFLSRTAYRLGSFLIRASGH
jgi:DNA invertase Pin-like site-specific DNA recombinase